MTSKLAQVWRAIQRIPGPIAPKLERALQFSSGLPVAWFEMLGELEPHGRLTMTELAERVVLSRTRVSRLIDDLEAAGLVEREKNPEDARSWFAVITVEGRRRFGNAAPAYNKALNEALSSDLSPQELVQLGELLTRLQRGEAS